MMRWSTVILAAILVFIQVANTAETVRRMTENPRSTLLITGDDADGDDDSEESEDDDEDEDDDSEEDEEVFWGYEFTTLKDLPVTTVYYYNPDEDKSFKLTYYGNYLPTTNDSMIHWLENIHDKDYLPSDEQYLSPSDIKNKNMVIFSTNRTSPSPLPLTPTTATPEPVVQTTTRLPPKPPKPPKPVAPRTTTKGPPRTTTKMPQFNWREFLGPPGECGWAGEKLRSELQKRLPPGHNKITAGRPSEIRDNPWQVALYNIRLHELECGGAIIGRTTVVTASHCFEKTVVKAYNNNETYEEVDQVPMEEIQVIVGSMSPRENGQRYLLRRVFTHSVYASRHHRNDIALLEIDGSFDWSPEVYPVCLPSSGKEEYNTGRKCRISGYGDIGYGEPNPDGKLRDAETFILSDEECLKENQKHFVITSAMFCAANDVGESLIVDTCQGDSGGPLVSVPQSIDEQSVLLGVTSFGTGCGFREQPGLYTKVGNYLRFLENKLKVVAKVMRRIDLPFDIDEGVPLNTVPGVGKPTLRHG